MVYSKEYFMNKAHGFDIYKPLSSYQKIMISDKVANLESYIEEAFYTKNNFKTVYGIDKNIFDYAVNKMYQFIVLGDSNNQEKINNFFDSMIDRYGIDKIFRNTQQNILSNEYSALPPQTALNYIKLCYMRGIVDQNTIDNFIMDLMTERAMMAADFIKKSRDYKGFRAYKKDYIDKLTNKTDKLAAVLSYIYADMCTTEGPVEKIAADYFMNISGLKYCFDQDNYNSKINHKRSEIKKWLSSHKKVKTFHDLTILDKNESAKNLIYQLFVQSGFALYNLNLFNDTNEIKIDNLLFFAICLEEYNDAYNTPEKAKELLFYLFYAIFGISERCMSYTEQYLNSALSYKRMSEDMIHSEAKLKNIIKNNEKQIKDKQNSLNKLQLEYNRLKNKELVNLKSELEKYKQLVKKLQEKNSNLEDINESLEARLKGIESESQEEKKEIIPNQDVEKQLRKLNITIMGGHQIWQNKIKEIYPYFNYIDADNVNFDINIIKNADFVLFNTLHCSHSLFYKVKNNINMGRKNESDKLILINSNNLTYFKNLAINLAKRS